MNLKALLKALKMKESEISMILGAVAIVIAGILIINFVKTRSAGVTLPITENTTQGPTIIRDGKTYHIVQAGESLWKIAEKYFKSGYNWVDIAGANKISGDFAIEKGQELYIPEISPKEETVAEVTKVAEPTEVVAEVKPTQKDASYTVVKGDSLWNIAVKEYNDGYKWVEIAKANGLVHPDIIHPGNVLTIPQL